MNDLMEFIPVENTFGGDFVMALVLLMSIKGRYRNKLASN